MDTVLLGKGSKTPITALCRDGGGVPPLAVIFFPLTFWPVACRDGGGVPPLAVIKKSVENWPKNSVFSCPDFRLRQLYTYPCHSLTDWGGVLLFDIREQS